MDNERQKVWVSLSKLVLCVVVFLCSTVLSFAQDKDTLAIERYYLFEGEEPVFDLEEIRLLPKLKFDDRKDLLYYYWFRKKVLKAYPFAIQTAYHLNELDKRLEGISSKRKKKRFIKGAQKYLESEFSAQLKKLTRTEGRILIKLVYRQTGLSVFELIKSYRSGWKAFWYQVTAKMFKMTLKEGYNPKEIKEDYMIEDILVRAAQNRIIELEPSVLDFDYYQLENLLEKNKD